MQVNRTVKGRNVSRYTREPTEAARLHAAGAYLTLDYHVRGIIAEQVIGMVLEAANTPSYNYTERASQRLVDFHYCMSF